MEECYDIIIVGGGIHGAGAAQAAAAQGFTTLLLEQNEIASGTSSRSSKLIHGGLRYLESAQFALVRECLQERSILLKLAPDLVKLIPCHIPVYKQTTRPAWKLKTGLALYGVLCGLRPESRFKTLARHQWQHLDGLRTQELTTVLQYWDAQTDDAALTKAVLHSAQSLGTEVRCPATLTHAHQEGQHWNIQYQSANINKHCRSRWLINAAGPWVNELIKRIFPTPPRSEIELIQGTHLIIDKPTQAGLYYVEAPRDRRAVFVIPWKDKHTLIGTTETPYSGDPGKVTPQQEEVDYLLETYHHYFDQNEPENILSQFAGLRVLPASSGHAFHRPRDTSFAMSDSLPGVSTIYGGKLTAYRATSEKLIKLITPYLPARTPKARTDSLFLSA